jgi:hypothetical protein
MVGVTGSIPVAPIIKTFDKSTFLAWRSARISVGRRHDIMARLMGPKMADRLGRPMIVENRAVPTA